MTSLLDIGSAVLVDVAIAFLVLEVIVYVLTPTNKTRNTLFLANGFAGLCLLLALRAAIHDSGQGWIVAALIGALLAHLIDLTLRRRLESTTSNLVAEQHGQR